MPVELDEKLTDLGDYYQRVAPPISTTEIGARRARTDDPELVIDVGPMGPLHDPGSTRRARWLAGTAAAVTVAAGLAGFAWITDQPTGLPLGVGAEQPASSEVIGLFPAGRLEDVVAANYSTPQDVAQAYLDDRTRRSQLPKDYGAQAEVTGGTIEVDANRALVPFVLETVPPYDTGEGYVLTRSTSGSDGDTRWYVVAASVARFDAELSYEDGTLSATYSTTAGGTTSITVHDATGSTVIASHDSDRRLVEGEGPSDTPEEERVTGTVRLAVSDERVVSVRFWNIGNRNDGRIRAVFAEGLIAHGQTGIHAGWEPLDSLAAQSGD